MRGIYIGRERTLHMWLLFCQSSGPGDVGGERTEEGIGRLQASQRECSEFHCHIIYICVHHSQWTFMCL